MPMRRALFGNVSVFVRGRAIKSSPIGEIKGILFATVLFLLYQPFLDGKRKKPAYLVFCAYGQAKPFAHRPVGGGAMVQVFEDGMVI